MYFFTADFLFYFIFVSKSTVPICFCFILSLYRKEQGAAHTEHVFATKKCKTELRNVFLKSAAQNTKVSRHTFEM